MTMKTLKEMMNLIELPEIVQTELLSIESTCALQKEGNEKHGSLTVEYQKKYSQVA